MPYSGCASTTRADRGGHAPAPCGRDIAVSLQSVVVAMQPQRSAHIRWAVLKRCNPHSQAVANEAARAASRPQHLTRMPSAKLAARLEPCACMSSCPRARHASHRITCRVRRPSRQASGRSSRGEPPILALPSHAVRGATRVVPSSSSSTFCARRERGVDAIHPHRLGCLRHRADGGALWRRNR